MWDVFISHAWEDKEAIARPLANALAKAGLRVWYDELTLTLGDSLRRSIDRGLAESKYGIVILSPQFFAKSWPQRELDGLTAREVSSGKTILPVWHNVTREDVEQFSLILADKLGVSTAGGLDNVVREILRVVCPELVNWNEIGSLSQSPLTPARVAGEVVSAPAVARPVNLSFDAYTVDGWPSGWFNSLGYVDGVSTTYEARVVVRPDDANGACVLFRNLHASEDEFGSLMQRCPAHNLAGKAIRLEAEIKTWQVEQWAGLWIRADGDNVSNLVFDNMSRRPIRGSTAWKRYAIDVQLPQETTWLNYGIVLAGRGTMWADNFRLMVWTNSGWGDV